MRSTLLRLAVLPLLLGADVAPTTLLPGRFDLVLGAVGSGTETFELRRTEAGIVLTSTLELSMGPQSVTFRQRSTLSADGTRIVGSELAVEGAGTAATLRATAGAEGTWVLEARQQGVDDVNRREVPVKAGAVLLDNLLPSQLDLLTRSLRLAPGEEWTSSAVVPQAMTAVPMTVRRLQDVTGTIGGVPTPAVRYRISAAAVLMEVDARAADGALLQARVPVQGVSYTRPGYTPPADPAAVPLEDARERAVTVAGPAVPLPGILTMAAAEGPVPAVLLLAGSGPQDRDETIGSNKPLRDLARGLADRGIASLRFDKRTWVRRDPAIASTLADEYLVDARAGLEVLRSTAGVDPERLVVAGHSLGATVAPMLGGERGVRGLVLLAPMVRRIDEALVDQIAFQLRTAGMSNEEIVTRTREVAEYFDELAAGTGEPIAFMGAPPVYWRELLGLDVPRLVRDTRVPVLVLQGAKDIQVRAQGDFERLQKALGDTGGRVSFQLFPDLNHLFMKVEGASTGAEYGIPGRVAPEVLDAIAAWIKALPSSSGDEPVPPRDRPEALGGGKP